MSEVRTDSLVNQSGDNDSGIDLFTNDVVAIKTANSEALRVDSSGNVGIGTSSPQSILSAKVSASRQLDVIKDSSDDHLVLKSSAPDASYNLRAIELAGERVAFSTGASSGTSYTEAARIDSSGNLLVGTTSAGGDGVTIRGAQGGNFWSSKSNTTSADNQLAFYNPNGLAGYIQTSGSSTSYNTSSDYRLKENVTADWDATTRLKQLNPVRFNFIADPDTTVDGFLAHEVQDIVPEAISGTKDEVDEDGNAVMQGIDQSKLVPLLVKTIQELEARIAALENA